MLLGRGETIARGREEFFRRMLRAETGEHGAELGAQAEVVLGFLWR